MSSGEKKKIALIICSQRNPRVGPKVASLVLQVLTAHEPTSPAYDLHLIDLADYALPVFDEPVMPALVPSKMSYVHAHTQRWSATIAAHAAFIFVTPQYNWGYPASLKNAIDYLYSEWKGKPALIVSYGNRGGGRAAGQLRQVLEGVRMRVVETMPGLAFREEEIAWKAMTEGELAERARERWEREQGEEIVKGFEDLKELLLS
jgi:NAD(P)H-dependent FMN reductase